MGKYLIQIVRVGIIARFVLPEDYGIVAAVQGIIGLSTILGDFGMTTAALQKRTLSSNSESAFFWFNVVIGSLLVIILSLIAPFIGNYLNNFEAVNIVYALAINYLIISLYSQALVKLKRELKFKRITLLEISTTIVSSFVGVMLAINGYKYWSLIYMQLADSILLLFGYFILSKYKIRKFKIDDEIKGSMKFGISVNIMNVLNRITKNADLSLLGRFAGITATGFYSRAISLTNILNTQLRGTIFTVSFPILAKNQDNDLVFFKKIFESYALIVFINCLIGGVLFWFADVIISLYLGPGWDDVVPLLRIISVSFLFLPFNTISDQIPLAKGDSLSYNKIGVAKNVIKLSLIISGTLFWGLWGCALGLVISEFVNVFIIILLMKKYTLQINKFVLTSLFPFLFCLSSGIVCYVLNSLVVDNIFNKLVAIALYCTLFFLQYIAVPANSNYEKIKFNAFFSKK
ncbi:MAG: hypothetical protein A2W93_04755 [Bacteroidetes bacterium GWF2_43_63]|nr:MAG: hypothetical protein A2W94_12745 [Bacteroidetes bacterium GWE2_42_42]OFY56066.1 MAG: hypothetical protein A2W93_04755 [Bacteroidetes bacterium GWF2_43_63]